MRSCIEEAAQARLETELAADSASNTNHYTARKHYKWRKKICTEPGNERSLEKKKILRAHSTLFWRARPRRSTLRPFLQTTQKNAQDCHV